MRNVRLSPEDADLLDAVIAAGVVALRGQMVNDGPGPLNLAPVSAGWRESMGVVTAFRETLRAPEGASVLLPPRSAAPEGPVR